MGRKGKIERKVSERNSAVTWSVTACKLGELTDKFRIGTKSEEWYLIFAAPSSIQGD